MSALRVVAGPSLPPGFQREPDSSDDEAVGPALPSSAQQSEVGQGTRIFLEREARRKEAQEEAARAAEKAANARPDWMLLPPSLGNASLQSVAGDPLSLKSRGFAQTTPRVSARGGRSGGDDDTSLWTETPEQRLQRLQDEAAGVSRAGSSKDAEAALERELQAKRDQAIAEQVRSQRKEKTLVEEHREKRRQERKEGRHGDDDRRRHSRHRSRSPDHRSSHRHEDREARRQRKREQRKKDEPKERKLTRQEREDLDLQNGRMAAPSIWDREAALSVGGKLMDEKKRGKMLADASALGDRFGSGSRRFM